MSMSGKIAGLVLLAGLLSGCRSPEWAENDFVVPGFARGSLKGARVALLPPESAVHPRFSRGDVNGVAKAFKEAGVGEVKIIWRTQSQEYAQKKGFWGTMAEFLDRFRYSRQIDREAFESIASNWRGGIDADYLAFVGVVGVGPYAHGTNENESADNISRGLTIRLVMARLSDGKCMWLATGGGLPIKGRPTTQNASNLDVDLIGEATTVLLNNLKK